jgi:hypothetical protein
VTRATDLGLPASAPTHAPSIQFKATVGFDAFVISALLSPPDPNLAAQLRFDAPRYGAMSVGIKWGGSILRMNFRD